MLLFNGSTVSVSQDWEFVTPPPPAIIFMAHIYLCPWAALKQELLKYTVKEDFAVDFHSIFPRDYWIYFLSKYCYQSTNNLCFLNKGLCIYCEIICCNFRPLGYRRHDCNEIEMEIQTSTDVRKHPCPGHHGTGLFWKSLPVSVSAFPCSAFSTHFGQVSWAPLEALQTVLVHSEPSFDAK
jgi:hypothetical protein